MDKEVNRAATRDAAGSLQNNSSLQGKPQAPNGAQNNCSLQEQLQVPNGEQVSCATVTNLTKAFGATVALDNLSLSFAKGQITGLLGADGAGKTTLLRLLLGLMLPTSGSITTLGLNPSTQKDELVQRIGYMPQKFGLYEDLTVQENLELYAELKQADHDFTKVLEMTALTPFQNRLAGKLSGGMKQKLGLACTLLGQPELLILDEPSVGVDPISRRELIKLVKDSLTPNTAVIWSTAYLDEAHNFATVAVMDRGRLLFQGAPELLSPTAQGFEDRVVELMGGFDQSPSGLTVGYEVGARPVATATESNPSKQSEQSATAVAEGGAVTANATATSAAPLTVEADSLCKRYGDFYAVKNNTFRIRQGEILGLLGPNGAGKSTSFKMMCGLAKPTSGTARIMGVDVVQEPSKARSYLGYMAQRFSLYGDLSIKDNLEFFAGIYGLNRAVAQERIQEVTELFDFDHYRNQPAKDLPLGIKQRLSLACAVLHHPPVIFLDEPTSGVDVVGRREFWKHIKALAAVGVTVLVTTHFMDEAEYCDHISLFYHGETIALDTPAALKAGVGATTMEEAFIKLIEQSEQA